jgi:hypothetical protein
MPTKSQTPSRQVLEETPSRALAFLRAVGTSAPIRAALAKAGYTEEEHALGWSLLHKVSGYSATMPKATEDTSARDAIAELDALDEGLFRRVRAALRRLHPEQEAYVFGDELGPAQGAASVISVSTLLQRLDGLKSAPERKKTRKQDQAALDTLAARGITAEERERLRALVEAAQRAVAVSDEETGSNDAGEREQGLLALRSWYLDWSDTARSVITRRDYLIRLGLAQRKKAAKKSAPAEEPEPK